ncbi:dienelactone hydrolase family protein [Algoriphagus sp. PAP.12]|uniref:dienelactone hydrolase family protein n=1 Tax=Algoriphagus sp. PAP.12 TaxID=2996678 RepID=UPI00227AEBDF|nr:acetylxylan esterase [Algoriphagus sp. PAP.12]
MKILLKFTTIIALSLLPFSLLSQIKANYDESKVPSLALPDLFVSESGKIIQSADEWEDIRRPEIFQLFQQEVYGEIPKDFDKISFKLAQESLNPYPELAKLEEVDITVERNGNSHTMRINLFIPRVGKGPFPVILLINHRAKYPDGRLSEDEYWPVEELVKRGYATASFHAETVAPDNKDTYHNGIISNLYPEQIEKPDGLKALGAWGWGAMRAMDYFVQHPEIDSEKSAIVGHSRSGKSALWTSANDPRWAITYSNESGCGGAALSKRKYGETVQVINTSFPHWFNENFKKYNNNEESLPLDQHMLLSLIAPRALYVASAKGDQWADPKGEYLSLQIGSRVQTDIYQKNSSFETDFESISKPIHLENAGYHIREGKHSLKWEDWGIFLEFAAKILQ